jgi:hypothetical protein
MAHPSEDRLSREELTKLQSKIYARVVRDFEASGGRVYPYKQPSASRTVRGELHPQTGDETCRTAYTCCKEGRS